MGDPQHAVAEPIAPAQLGDDGIRFGCSVVGHDCLMYVGVEVNTIRLDRRNIIGLQDGQKFALNEQNAFNPLRGACIRRHVRDAREGPESERWYGACAGFGGPKQKGRLRAPSRPSSVRGA